MGGSACRVLASLNDKHFKSQIKLHLCLKFAWLLTLWTETAYRLPLSSFKHQLNAGYITPVKLPLELPITRIPRHN